MLLHPLYLWVMLFYSCSGKNRVASFSPGSSPCQRVTDIYTHIQNNRQPEPEQQHQSAPQRNIDLLSDSLTKQVVKTLL